MLEKKGFEYCGIATKSEVKKISQYGEVHTVCAPNFKYKVYMKPGEIADQAKRFLLYGNFEHFFKNLNKV